MWFHIFLQIKRQPSNKFITKNTMLTWLNPAHLLPRPQKNRCGSYSNLPLFITHKRCLLPYFVGLLMCDG